MRLSITPRRIATPPDSTRNVIGFFFERNGEFDHCEPAYYSSNQVWRYADNDLLIGNAVITWNLFLRSARWRIMIRTPKVCLIDGFSYSLERYASLPVRIPSRTLMVFSASLPLETLETMCGTFFRAAFTTSFALVRSSNEPSASWYLLTIGPHITRGVKYSMS